MLYQSIFIVSAVFKSCMMDDDVVVVLMDDCVSQQYDVMGELNAEKEAQAKFIYSVFRSYGFNNASMAGILRSIVQGQYHSNILYGRHH